ncbi:hypothetical protein HID58_055935 [Brassica napus]|uniref:Uncharacterized protein n=1 Tax=Brassica napus TaxID=3708 RepID=A0ABQ8ALX1_BRANA|nr:hypothetical protein HID58_055935 [Brassica napus]
MVAVSMSTMVIYSGLKPHSARTRCGVEMTDKVAVVVEMEPSKKKKRKVMRKLDGGGIGEPMARFDGGYSKPMRQKKKKLTATSLL